VGAEQLVEGLRTELSAARQVGVGVCTRLRGMRGAARPPVPSARKGDYCSGSAPRVAAAAAAAAGRESQ